MSVISVPRGLGKSDLEATALALDKVQHRLAGASLVKTIHVPGKLVNFVV